VAATDSIIAQCFQIARDSLRLAAEYEAMGRIETAARRRAFAAEMTTQAIGWASR
jgi:hypothetical protein